MSYLGQIPGKLNGIFPFVIDRLTCHPAALFKIIAQEFGAFRRVHQPRTGIIHKNKGMDLRADILTIVYHVAVHKFLANIIDAAVRFTHLIEEQVPQPKWINELS